MVKGLRRKGQNDKKKDNFFLEWTNGNQFNGCIIYVDSE